MLPFPSGAARPSSRRWQAALLAAACIAISCGKPPEASSASAAPIDPATNPAQQPAADVPPIVLRLGQAVVTLRPVAQYRIAARVVGRERYHRGWEADLAPVDLALAWGRLADRALDRYITYSQGSRWYEYTYSEEIPVSPDYIVSHSANTHMIPADENMRRAILSVETGDLVLIEGYLVNIVGQKEGETLTMETSLSREDNGSGSCEIVYVLSLQVNDTLYLARK